MKSFSHLVLMSFLLSVSSCRKVDDKKDAPNEENAEQQVEVISSRPVPKEEPTKPTTAETTPPVKEETGSDSTDIPQVPTIPPVVENPPTLVVENTIKKVEGEFQDLNDQTVQFSLFQEKPLVLLIGSYDCSGCIAETVALKKFLSENMQDRLPSNVDIVNVMIGAIKEDALDWNRKYILPWTFGYQESTKKLISLCPKRVTPCTIIQLPQKGIVFAENGVVHAEQMQEITGPWF